MSGDQNRGTATVADALDMLREAGVDLARELSNINAAYLDICDELTAEGYSEIGFVSADLAAAMRAVVEG